MGPGIIRSAIWWMLACACVFISGIPAQGEAAPAGSLTVSVDPGTCLYSLGAESAAAPVLNAGIAAKVDHAWLHASDYRKCTIVESDVSSVLGHAHQWVVEYSGIEGKPDLGYTLRSYAGKPFVDVQASVINRTGQTVEVEAIRSIEAPKGVDMGGPSGMVRVLSDSFSEDRPAMRIHDLGDAENQMHRGVGSQLIYNRQTHRSLFVGALTSDRYLTILRLHVGGSASDPSIQSYEVDSTGTTEMAIENSLRNSPAEDRVELSLPVAPGDCMQAERLLVGIDSDPHRQLDAYGDLIRMLHHPRPAKPTPIGWWSWTAYYFGLNEGAALTNANWLAQNLKPLGYDFFHIDEGYQYARGEYATPDATLFPDGMQPLERKVASLGLTPGIWTAPFEVAQRSWVFQNHPDWLVHNANGKPIALGTVDEKKDQLYALDVTNPGAQQYLRYTYKVMSQDWGIQYFKFDFMEDSAVEGYYYKPHTTALEAQRIGLGLIRDVVGDSVLLDKDGSVMLNPVGYVDEGRISQDTGHAFEASRDAATGIAARYYMNHNFYTTDPDAFSVSTQTLQRHWHGGDQPLTLDEARVSIALSAVSGGMYEIGDDLPTLGADPERVALVKNPYLLEMARLGRASTPVDLMDYLPEDGQPSIFYLKEDSRQSILTVFNWTDKPRTHTFHLAEFGLPVGSEKIFDVFTNLPVSLSHDVLTVEQPAHSVRVLRLENASAPLVHPAISARRLTEGRSGETLGFSASTSDASEPVLSYEWDFGDGVTANSASPSHTYTAPGTYHVRVKANFLNGTSSDDSFQLSITGVMNTELEPAQKRRFVGPE